MDKTEVITATEASRSFSEVLHRVCYGGESFIIKKGSRMMARIVPVEVVEEESVAAPETAMASEDDSTELPPGVSEDEAEYYRAWIAQVRKVPSEMA